VSERRRKLHATILALTLQEIQETGRLAIASGDTSAAFG
jgi:hypothetical protein